MVRIFTSEEAKRKLAWTLSSPLFLMALLDYRSACVASLEIKKCVRFFFVHQAIIVDLLCPRPRPPCWGDKSYQLWSPRSTQGSQSLVCELLFLLNIFLFFIVVQVHLFPLSLHHAPSPHPCPPHPLEPTPFGFVHVLFIHVPWCLPRIIPCYPCPSSSLITVRLFFISMSLSVFCLLVCFVD